MLNKVVIAASLCLAVSLVYGQAKIVDSKPMSGRDIPAERGGYAHQASPRASASPQSEMYYQLQLLQEEVQQLRGLVEQQAYELKRLKQQRLDDYLDLDRRIGSQGASRQSDGQQGPGGVFDKSSSISDASGSAAGSDGGLYQKGEFASYQAAIGLALKQRDFDGAVSALKEHLEKFPAGSYVPNAQYWLGQIYLQQGDLEQSRQWFSKMTEQFPTHQKAAEAKFKLGKVLHKLGETAQAKALLQAVVESGSSASGLARDYLKQNF